MTELSPMETAVLFDRVAKKEAQMNEQSGRCAACNAPVERPHKGMLSGVESGLCRVCNNDVNVLLVTRDMQDRQVIECREGRTEPKHTA